MDSDAHGRQLLSVVSGLELGWRNVADGRVRPVLLGWPRVLDEKLARLRWQGGLPLPGDERDTCGARDAGPASSGPRRVEAGHELAVRQPGGGELLSALVEADPQVGNLGFERGDALVETADGSQPQLVGVAVGAVGMAPLTGTGDDAAGTVRRKRHDTGMAEEGLLGHGHRLVLVGMRAAQPGRARGPLPAAAGHAAARRRSIRSLSRCEQFDLIVAEAGGGEAATT